MTARQTAAKQANTRQTLRNTFLDNTGVTALRIPTRIAKDIKMNSIINWVMIAPKSPRPRVNDRFGMRYSHKNIQIRTPIPFTPSKTFCLPVATKT